MQKNDKSFPNSKFNASDIPTYSDEYAYSCINVYKKVKHGKY